MDIVNIGDIAVNNYLIKTEMGYIALDTGYAGGVGRYSEGLKKNSIPFEDIKFIVLTHAHDDHAGFLNELISETNAVVIADKLSPDRLAAGHNCYCGVWLDKNIKNDWSDNHRTYIWAAWYGRRYTVRHWRHAL